jgi:hypothetical protein
LEKWPIWKRGIGLARGNENGIAGGRRRRWNKLNRRSWRANGGTKRGILRFHSMVGLREDYRGGSFFIQIPLGTIVMRRFE